MKEAYETAVIRRTKSHFRRSCWGLNAKNESWRKLVKHKIIYFELKTFSMN
ncbi:hypothetical protein KHA80_19600 [Anaerobacillus sp. HL2]|nr:hypothetical protein KHA80_19600 [Anaerobacillus sp. HL2]